MTITELIQYAIFAALTLVTVGGAIKVAATRRIIHAAYWLFPVFAGMAGFYLCLGAQFIAAMQVLIYIGAILILIIFAVTLTRHANDPEELQSNRFVAPVVLASLAMLLPLVGAVLLHPWAALPPPPASIDNILLMPGVPVTDVQALGITLMQQYLVPFEIASVLLLAAMVGALVLARKERPTVPAASDEMPADAVLPDAPATREKAEVS